MGGIRAGMRNRKNLKINEGDGIIGNPRELNLKSKKQNQHFLSPHLPLKKRKERNLRKFPESTSS